MGLIFNNKKKIVDNGKKEEKISPKYKLELDNDILNVLRREQNLPISDSEAETAVSSYEGLFDERDLRSYQKQRGNLSVAKTYGNKYVSDGTRRLASSDVVDVRSFSLHKEEREDNESISTKLDDEDDANEKDKSDDSFFDDLLKSLDEEVSTLNDENEGDKSEDYFEKKDEDVKQLTENNATVKKSSSKKKKKKKKTVDIDIISGDFGGNNII